MVVVFQGFSGRYKASDCTVSECWNEDRHVIESFALQVKLSLHYGPVQLSSRNLPLTPSIPTVREQSTHYCIWL